MNTIYILVVIANRNHVRTRTWVWFPTKEEAEQSVVLDADFYFEAGTYDYAVIEEVRSYYPGPHEQVSWWRAAYNYLAEPRHTVERCEAPEWAKHTVNWSLG